MVLYQQFSVALGLIDICTFSSFAWINIEKENPFTIGSDTFKFHCEDSVIVFLKAVGIMAGSDYHTDDADDLL